MVVNVFFAMSKDAMPPMAFLRCAKYEVGFDKTISMAIDIIFQSIATFEISDSMQVEKFSYEKRVVSVHMEYASHFISFCLIFLSNSHTGIAVIPPIMPAR